MKSGMLLVCTVLVQVWTLPALRAQSDQTEYPSASVHGSLRYRAEVDGRFFDLKAKPLKIDLLKTQIGATALLSPDVSVVVRFQDSRNFGEGSAAAARGTLDGSGNNTGLREGYGVWNNLFADGLSVRFGRMMFATNAERIIGSLEWHNVGRSFDGLEFRYSLDTATSVRAFAFKLGSDELTMTRALAQPPQSLFGLDLNLPWQNKLNAYAYLDRNASLVLRGPSAGETFLERGTLGVYLRNTYEKLEYEVEAAHQIGSRRTSDTTANDRISASLFTAFVSYRMSSELSTGIGVDAYTGNNISTRGVDESFEHLFITIHKFYGFMDFFPFTVIPSSGQRAPLAASVTNAGLMMVHSRSSYIVSKNCTVQLWAMMFNAHQPVPGTSSRYLGSEIDFTASYILNKNVRVDGGCCLFLPGETIRQSNGTQGMGTDVSYWSYVMLTLTF